MGLLNRKKNLLVMFASPNSQQNTRTLLNSFLQPFEQDKDWKITEMNTYEMRAKPCVGCRACAKKEQCVFDDLNDFDKAFRQSDLFVVASPVYFDSFPSPFKAVLDRMQRYFEARFSLGIEQSIKKSRKAVLLLTMGSEQETAIEVTIRQLEMAFGVMNTELSGCAVWSGTDRNKAEDRAFAQKKAHELALEILGRP
ncbi:flavodoxin family protein [Scatolibacter rhodanostii]|uniref:flavodoxin family protein n=1 Tax=Scatolibacter rhodanostii TaxID=2014781 RepID=UPI000C085366|nr:flavodoxin family protein [Scatolibacter rhodanostii]